MLGVIVYKKIKHKIKNKIKHKKKAPSKAKKIKSDNTLTKKSDEDGVLIFQYDLLKPQWILKKLKSHFSLQNDEECKAWGLKV